MFQILILGDTMKVVPFKDEYVCVRVFERGGERDGDRNTERERKKEGEKRGRGRGGRRKREGSQTLLRSGPVSPAGLEAKPGHKGLILFVNEIWITSTIPSFSLKILLPCHFYFTL